MCNYCDCTVGNSATKSIVDMNIDAGAFGNFLCSAVLFGSEDETVMLLSVEHQEQVIKIKYCPMCGRKLRKS